MSIEVQMPASGVIKATESGDLNLKAAEQMLDRVAAIAQRKASVRILLDTREAITHLSATDMYVLVKHLMKGNGTWARKTAIVASPKDSDKLAFFELCAQNRGVCVHIFTDYDEAMNWLSWPVMAQAIAA